MCATCYYVTITVNSLIELPKSQKQNDNGEVRTHESEDTA